MITCLALDHLTLYLIAVRKLGKPPHLIMRIMDAVLLLFQRKIDPVQKDPEKESVKPSWGEALKLMSVAHSSRVSWTSLRYMNRETSLAEPKISKFNCVIISVK